MKKFYVLFFLLSLLLALNTWASEEDFLTAKVRKHDSISLLCFKIYRGFLPEMLTQLTKINPHINDWNKLPTDVAIKFFARKEMDRMIPEQMQDRVVITFLKQPVSIKRGDNNTYKKAQINSILEEEDFLKVGKGGRAELIMSGGRILRLDEGSRLKIGELEINQSENAVVGKFRLFIGKIWGKLLKTQLFSKAEMYVATPTVIAGVRGTAYDMMLSPDQSTVIKVFEGEVEIYNPLQKMPESGVIKDYKEPRRVKGPHRVTEEQWTQILLRQYYQIMVSKEGAGKAFSFDYEKERQTEWIKWNEERDQELSGMAL